jgi:hypothetical protein
MRTVLGASIQGQLDGQVDTEAKPPRSIWTHPYEDPEYLSQHPDDADKLKQVVDYSPPPGPPPTRRNTIPETMTTRNMNGKLVLARRVLSGSLPAEPDALYGYPTGFIAA